MSRAALPPAGQQTPLEGFVCNRGVTRRGEKLQRAKAAAENSTTSAPRYARGESTGEVEWYTPPAYLDLAREVLGGIGLGPASSHLAQRHSLMLRLKWMKSPLRSASGSKRLWDFFAVAGRFPWYQYSAFRRGGPSNRCFTFRPYCQRVRFVMNDSVSPNRPMVTEDISIKSVSRRNGW